jgi:hypothetical protein
MAPVEGARPVGAFLESLRQADDCHLIEQTEEGFAIVRRSADRAAPFNELAREAIQRSGSDYVALPRTDGSAGYDQVFIIPID